MSSFDARRPNNQLPASETARVTVRVPTDHLEDIEQLVDAGEYQHRSAAIREAIRQHVNDRDVGGEDR